MSFSQVDNVTIEAICGCVPKNEINNAEIGKELFQEELDNVILATGIEKRRVCKKPTTTALDLSVTAAQTIFKKSDINKNDIGGIVFVTFTPDHIMPFNAGTCQHKLGLPIDIPGFDINLACSGYPYGLWVASMMANNLQKKILLLDGDKQSHLVSSKDEATALLFSDAGTASIISPTKEKSTFYFSFFTDGEKKDVLVIEDGGSRNWISQESFTFKALDKKGKRRKTDIFMNGFEVFRFAVQNVPKNLKALVEHIHLSMEDFDLLVLHQANKYMVSQIAKAVKIPLQKTPMTMNIYGNSSSATVPITLASHLYSNNNESIYQKALVSGFGAGLSIGSAAIDLGNCISYGVCEYEE